jgi:hypothetical protein
MKIAAYGPSMGREWQENIMYVCLEAIEAYNECATEPSLMRFTWFLTTSIPFLAYVNLLFNLRYRANGELADRAWETVATRTDAFGRPRWLWSLSASPLEPHDSAIQLAFASLSVKAWEAREAAIESDLSLNAPPLITMMKEKLASSKGRHNMLSNAGAASNLIKVNTLTFAGNQALSLSSTSTYTGEMTNLTLSEAPGPAPTDTMESSHQQVMPVDDDCNVGLLEYFVAGKRCRE